ncbi:MAG: hypothetical protein ACLQFR_17180 [Streptosporangiaceae bacterium]
MAWSTRRIAWALAAAEAAGGIRACAKIEAELRVELHGAGPDFCAGGDLDEFGTRPDPAQAHLEHCLERAEAVDLRGQIVGERRLVEFINRLGSGGPVRP